MTKMTKKPRGAGRACIPHAALHTAGIGRGGKRPAQFNPIFQVEHQDEPTTSHPVRQHFKLATPGGSK